MYCMRQHARCTDWTFLQVCIVTSNNLDNTNPFNLQRSTLRARMLLGTLTAAHPIGPGNKQAQADQVH